MRKNIIEFFIEKLGSVRVKLIGLFRRSIVSYCGADNR